MDKILSHIRIKVHPGLYHKDPESSELGRKILTNAIEQIECKGFEAFTFRKLAQAIPSTEASVYRYFESKHKLLLYLISWYWAWLEYRLVFGLANIESPIDRLHKAVSLLTETVEDDGDFSYLNKSLLYRIVIAESSKAYFTKSVDEENKEGIYLGYKQLVQRVSDIIKEINPDYPFSHMLVSTVLEGAQQQRFFAEHLPRLTDTLPEKDAVSTFYTQLVMRSVKNKPSNK